MTHGLAGEQAGLRGSRQIKNRLAALVLAAVEKRGKASGRARMSVIPDFKAAAITPFLTKNIAPGSTIYTDGLKSFAGLAEAGFKHVVRLSALVQREMESCRFRYAKEFRCFAAGIFKA